MSGHIGYAPFALEFIGGVWPHCFYDNELLCGEKETRVAGQGSAIAAEMVRRNWHVADLCECPSCPVRCALRDLVHGEKEA